MCSKTWFVAHICGPIRKQATQLFFAWENELKWHFSINTKVASYHLNQWWQISKHSMTSLGCKYLNDSSHTNGEMEFGTYTSFNQLCLIFMVRILTFTNIANVNNVVQILPNRCKSKGCFSRMCTVVGICETWYITNFANAITIVITCSRI